MSFDIINLEGLPAPEVLESISFDDLLLEWKADYKKHYDALAEASDEELPDYDTLMLESEPVVLALRAGATREMLLRQRINDAIKAVMLRYSYGDNLENLAAFHGVERQEGESDRRLQHRISLAPSAYSSAGPIDAYRFYALTAAPEAIHVNVFVAGTGDNERIVVMPLTLDGIVSDETLDKIRAALDGETDVPATDVVDVRRPHIITYGLRAELRIPYGADRSLVLNEARKSLIEYEATRRKIGANIYRSGLIAALKIQPVEDVILYEPLNSIEISRDAVAILNHDDINLQIEEADL